MTKTNNAGVGQVTDDRKKSPVEVTKTNNAVCPVTPVEVTKTNNALGPATDNRKKSPIEVTKINNDYGPVTDDRKKSPDTPLLSGIKKVVAVTFHWNMIWSMTPMIWSMTPLVE